MTKVIPNNRKFNIDHQYFSQINSDDKAFWFGYFLHYYRSILRRRGKGEFSLSLSFSKNESLLFQENLKSTYPIRSRGDYFTTHIQSKNILNDLIANITNHKLLDKSVYCEILLGFISNGGYFNRSKTASSGSLILEIGNYKIYRLLSNILKSINIKYTLNKNKNIYGIYISNIKSLISIFNLSRDSNHELPDTLKGYQEYIHDIEHHVSLKEKIIYMILNDFDHGLPKSQIITKYNLGEQVINRIIDKHTDEYNCRLNIGHITKCIYLYELCRDCNIFKEINTSCIYCNTTNVGSISRIWNHSKYTSKAYAAHIRVGLKRCVSNKDTSNYSIQDHLGYSFLDLKTHIESLFEPWMNWDNWKGYSARRWDDNDQSTWVWNIDHIIPQSTFQIRDKADIDFKKCWAISNLRPFSGKQNIIDGASRVRHQLNLLQS